MKRNEVFLGQRVKLKIPHSFFDKKEGEVTKRPSKITGDSLVKVEKTELLVKLYEMEPI